MPATEPKNNVHVQVEPITEFKGTDLSDICDATEATLKEDALSFSMGFIRTDVPSRERLEAYWKGVLLVQERQLFVGRLDGTIAASIQLVKPSQSNQTSRFAASIDHHFVAPWARGHKLAKMLLKKAEDEAREQGFTVLRLSVRANLEAAVKLYELMGYIRWGILDKYEQIEGRMLAGYYYYKDLA